MSPGGGLDPVVDGPRAHACGWRMVAPGPRTEGGSTCDGGREDPMDPAVGCDRSTPRSVRGPASGGRRMTEYEGEYG